MSEELTSDPGADVGGRDPEMLEDACGAFARDRVEADGIAMKSAVTVSPAFQRAMSSSA